MFFCTISGEIPEDPVVSSKSGRLYERRLILKYINENGNDPFTGEKLEEADLVSIKSDPKAAPPRPPTFSSIPALIQSLRNEWDAVVLENFTLRQQYNNTRQELSYSLYAQDAASRVVARLIKERDAAREALANVHATIGIAPPTGSLADVEMDDEVGVQESLPKEIVDQIDETQQTLSAARKKRKAPAGYATSSEVKTFTATRTIPSLHSASPAGITSLAISHVNPSQFLTGGNDKIVQLYDRSTDKVLASLKGHTKKINHVALRERERDNTLILSAGADKVAKVWSLDSASSEYIPKATVRTHKGELTGLAVHPTSTVVAFASLDKTYSLHELSNFTQIYRSAPSDEAFTSLAIHPDGALLALGTPASKIQICDVRSGQVAAHISPVDGTPFTVNTISFSENGYHLLAPDSSSSVAIWDLRKMKATHSIPLGEGFNVNKVVYDFSAQYLGVAGSQGIRVFAHKTWEELVRFEEGEEVSDMVFGEHGKDIWGVMGREVRIWSVPS